MKARVKATGEIVEVYQTLDNPDEWYNAAKYKDFDLDFGCTPLKDEATLKGWVARDSQRASNALMFHRNEVKRSKFYWDNKDPYRPIGESLILPNNLFPDITWETDPKQVEITIRIKK